MNILTAYPKVSIIIIALAVTFISSLITKFLTNQEHLHSLKARQKELQEEMKKHKDHPDKLMKLQSEMLQIMRVMMKSSFKPMFVTMIPFFILFYWIRNTYSPILPSWFWYYLGAGIISSILFRKWLKMA